MSKNKLKIDKFRISKLSNPIKIFGGDGGDNGETGKNLKCVDLSKRWVKEKNNDKP